MSKNSNDRLVDRELDETVAEVTPDSEIVSAEVKETEIQVVQMEDLEINNKKAVKEISEEKGKSEKNKHKIKKMKEKEKEKEKKSGKKKDKAKKNKKDKKQK